MKKTNDAKVTVKTASAHVHASINNKYSLVARNDGRTRIINSDGKGVGIFYGTKILTVASHDKNAISKIAKECKGKVVETGNLGANKFTTKVDLAKVNKSLHDILNIAFGAYNKKGDVKAQEKSTSEEKSNKPEQTNVHPKSSKSKSQVKTPAKKSTSEDTRLEMLQAQQAAVKKAAEKAQAQAVAAVQA